MQATCLYLSRSRSRSRICFRYASQILATSESAEGVGQEKKKAKKQQQYLQNEFLSETSCQGTKNALGLISCEYLKMARKQHDPKTI